MAPRNHFLGDEKKRDTSAREGPLTAENGGLGRIPRTRPLSHLNTRKRFVCNEDGNEYHWEGEKELLLKL